MRAAARAGLPGFALAASLLACEASGPPPTLSASAAATSAASIGGEHASSASAPASGTAPAIGASPKLEHDTLVTPPGVPLDGARPLVIFLHGLGATGEGLVRSLDVAPLSQRLGFSFVAPDGALDHHGRRFWNAGHACCDFDRKQPDHVRLIGALAPDLERGGAGRLTPVVVVGFSNGAFMAHRLACDVERVGAIVAIAGAVPAEGDPPCAPKHPVRVIVVHGDADGVVPYAGGPVLGDTTRVVPSAADTARLWADRNHCKGALGKPTRRDLVQRLDGEETRLEAFAGCDAPVELWTVEGADHLGVLSSPLVAAAVERALGS
jgi:polyhydroxybutyrate depolymerase